MSNKRRNDEITKENDKTFLEDGLSTNEIRETIKQLRSLYKKKSKEELEKQFPFFTQRYNMLFELAITDNFNQEYLDYFLNKRDEIINNKISSEEASKKVGQEWFDKFVKIDDDKYKKK